MVSFSKLLAFIRAMPAPSLIRSTSGENWEKALIIIAIQEIGKDFDMEHDWPDSVDIDLYACDSLKDLAQQFVEEGLFGDIQEHLGNYIDYETIAHDLGMDYAETVIAGAHYIYRCA